MGTVVETTVTMWQDPGSNVTCYRETLVRLASLNVTIKIIKYVIMGNVQVNGNKPLLCLGSPQLYSCTVHSGVVGIHSTFLGQC